MKQTVQKYFQLSLFFFLFSFSFNLFPQAYHFKTILTEQGQAIKQVRTMMQDSKGYLWIGSSGGGVCKYDGKNYFISTRKDGLCSDDVNCITEDAEGAIWFGTATGISQFKGGKFFNFPKEAELAKSSVFAIVKDKEKNIWLGTSNGAFKYSYGKFTRYAEKDGLSTIFIRAILCDTEGKLWFATVNGKIFMYENNSFKNADWANKISTNIIWFIFQDSKQNIWIGSDDGLYKRWKMKEADWKIEKTDLAGNSFLSICEDKNGNMWFGTAEIGIWKYDGKHFINFNEIDALASNIVYSIAEDREGNMWFGGYGTGISKLTMLSYEMYNKQRKFPQSFIWALKEDKAGNIWAGFNQPGISVIQNSESIFQKEILNFPTESFLYYIWFENETTVWAATVNGIEIFHFDKTKKSLKQIRKIDKKDGLTGNIVRYIYSDKKNDLWIATDFGVSVMKGKNFNDYKVVKTFTTQEGLVNNYVYSTVEDDNGNMWFATAGGVSRLNSDKKKFCNYTVSATRQDSSKQKTSLPVPSVSEGLANQDVRSIAKDNDGQLWFATGAGISFYDEKNDKFKSITSKNGLSVDRLYFLQYDSLRNALWVGTAFGLDKFDLGEYKRSAKINFTHPTAYDGFIEVETNTNAVCITQNGNLWLGTIDGLIKYYPDYVREKNQLEAQTHITKINVNRNDTFLNENSALPYEMNNISFTFTGISLSMPERVEYKYKLEGFDNDWSPAQKEIFAKYSNLPAGNFTFQVIASNNDGVWNKVPSCFNFSILHPWWQTWWFRIAVIIFLIGIILFYIKTREKKLIREKILLEEKVQMRTKELAEQKEKVEEKNKEITDSILYAKRIQSALLTSEKFLKQNLPQHFIFFKPRDIVSGDFYWMNKIEVAVGSSSKQSGAPLPTATAYRQLVILAVADCTGHGVPGAMMSMIGINKLTEIVVEKKIIQPDKILIQLRNEIISALNPDEYNDENASKNEVKDGMDIALVSLEFGVQSSEIRYPANYQLPTKLQYAGANNPLWVVRNNSLIEIKPDIFPVGKHIGETKPFSLKPVELQKGDVIYLFSDGYADQFGGPKGKKFKYAKFKELLLSVCNLPMEEQKKIIFLKFEEWKGKLNQVDDVCVVGIRV